MQGLRKGVVGLLMAAGLAASASVLAQEADSQNHDRIDRLLEHCEAEEGSWQSVGCAFYVGGYRNGILDTANRARQVFDIQEEEGHVRENSNPEGLANLVRGYCELSNQVTNGQLVKVFVKWANDHPERHHEEWSVGLHEAWSEAFPCGE